MLWHDEFAGPAGSAPNPKKWAYDLGNKGFSPGQTQVYTDSRANSFLDGHGHLVIRALKTGNVITSARLKSQGHFSALNGTWRALIKLQQTPGTWPAWWFLNTGSGYAEIDVLEQYGSQLGWAPTTSVHTHPDGSGGDWSTNITVDDQWHEWSMTWDAALKEMQFFKDNVQYWSTPMPAKWPPMFTLLNLATGGAGGGSTKNTKFPVDMLVDYVQCWV